MYTTNKLKGAAHYSMAVFLSFLCFCGSKPTSPDFPLVICGQNENISFNNNAERFGFFSESLYVDYKKCLTSFSTLYGVQPGFVLWFQQIDDDFPAAFVSYCAALSIHTAISLNIKSNNLDSIQNDTLLREIIGGLWDNNLKSFAMQAKQTGTIVYLRFGYEMNGSWFPWGGKSTDFISAWNHAYKIFQNEQAKNVLWVFSPGVLWNGATVDHDLLNYYPGDSVVDINGLDGYNYGDIIKNGYQLHWQSFQEVFGASLVALKKLGKPLWIAEIGCAVDPRRADWIKQFLNFMDNNPCVEAALWFNDHKENEPDFQLKSDSATFNVMKNWLLH